MMPHRDQGDLASASLRRSTSPLGSNNVSAAVAFLVAPDATVQHYTQYFEEANAEKNDRGAAILIATNLENALESAIIRQLQLGSKRRDLFGLNSPGGTFDFKIRIGTLFVFSATKHEGTWI